jgi:hypothetical protein
MVRDFLAFGDEIQADAVLEAARNDEDHEDVEENENLNNIFEGIPKQRGPEFHFMDEHEGLYNDHEVRTADRRNQRNVAECPPEDVGGDASDSDDDIYIDAVDEQDSSDNNSDSESEEDFIDEEEAIDELLGRVPIHRFGENPAIDVTSTIPLFEGSSLSSLCATLLVLNCCRTHGCSTVFINELLMILSKCILPRLNSLPQTEYQATKALNRLGLSYNIIHACPKGCVLFKDDLVDAEVCPECGEGRYKLSGRSYVPTKILRHFPIIPRLQRMFSTRKLAALQTWYVNNKSVDGMVRHTAYSKQWKFVDEKYPEFTTESRNIRLGLGTDGINPFSEKRSTHNLTPVVLLNYNLPPWLVTKKYFIMLSLLIPDKEIVTGRAFDTYLQPLLDELKLLWRPEGIQTRDAAAHGGCHSFDLRAILLWTLHDLPAYGTVAGCAVSGCKGCPVCGPYTDSRHSKYLNKNVFCNQQRRYLEMNHLFRGDYAAFDGKAENMGPPPPLMPNDVIQWGRESEQFVDQGGNQRDRANPAKRHGLKRVSALFQLPYWRVRTPKLSCELCDMHQ